MRILPALLLGLLSGCSLDPEPPPSGPLVFRGFPAPNGPVDRVGIDGCGLHVDTSTQDQQVRIPAASRPEDATCELRVRWQVGGCLGETKVPVAQTGQPVTVSPSRPVRAEEVARAKQLLAIYAEACERSDAEDRPTCEEHVLGPAQLSFRNLSEGIELGCPS